MPPLSLESIILLNLEQNICLGDQTITRAMFTKRAANENPPPYIKYEEFMPKVREEGKTEEALSFIHQDGLSNDEIAEIAKIEILHNPKGSVWYLAQLLIQKIAEMRYEDDTEIILTVVRDNNPFDRHTSMYPVSEDTMVQQTIAMALANIAGKPIPMKKGAKKFD
jgi:hypothetical protein